MIAPARFLASLTMSAALCGLFVLTGCSLAHFSDVSTASSVVPAVNGTVHGGQQPVSGSSIQLYAANILANKGASTPLIPIATPVVTDANGNFNITGKYACPTPNTLIYITANGGNPGLTLGTNNAGIALMTALGTCGTFFTGGNNISVIINELTTVAAIEALAPYTADLTHIGADTTANPNALANAFAAANAAVAYYAGQFTPQPAGSTFPTALYNTLANIAASCINSAGNTGPTTNCYKFFDANAVAADTFAALLSLAQNPANTAPFSLAGGTGAPFQPALTSQPPSFVPFLKINVPNNGEYRCCTKQQLAIDTSQQIWVGNSFTHTVHTYSNAGTLLYTITLPQALLNMASDPLGNTWFVVQATPPDTSYSILKYNASGVLVSPAAGWKANVGAGVQLYTFVATATDMKFDSVGNLFLTGQQGGTGNYCALKYANTGTYLQPICVSANGAVTGIAVDSSDNIYLAQSGGVNKFFKFTNLGVSITLASQPALSSIVGIYFMHYDPSTDHIWIFDGNDVAIYASNGTTVKAPYQQSLYFANPFALDGAGNGFACCSYQFGITRLDTTGTRTSPDLSNTSDGTVYAGYYLQGQNVPLPTMQVDGQGNIWGVGGDSLLYKVSGGLAVPRAQLFR